MGTRIWRIIRCIIALAALFCMCSGALAAPSGDESCVPMMLGGLVVWVLMTLSVLKDNREFAARFSLLWAWAATLGILGALFGFGVAIIATAVMVVAGTVALPFILIYNIICLLVGKR
ncbi:MAG: hypothetical protein IJB89_03515 [Akkermansia sp.]|nr:hypothetical protein [Akkermansiaceae bacterium]MBQ3143562.1 hypothetical protein [Akkermansia sp.]